MMRTALLLLLSSLSWAADNVCTFSKPSGATACNGSNVCTTSGIAADSSRAYWSCTVSSAGNGYVPAAPDSIVGPNGYTVTWDDRNFDMGASGNPYYSYPAYVLVDDAGTGYTSPPTVTLTCSGSCVKTGQYYISFWVNMNGSGGVDSIKFRTLNGAWFTPASGAPAITLSAPTSGTTTTAHIVMQPGGGTPMLLAHGTFQVQIGAGRSATFRGDALTDIASDTMNASGIVALSGGNTATFDSSLASPLGDGSRPMYSFGATRTQEYRGLDMSACAGTCTLTSNLSGGHGILFSHHGFNNSAAPQISTGKEALSHLGSAATPMYEAGLFGYTRDSYTPWNMPSYTCTDCGPVLIDGGAVWGNGGDHYTFIDGGIFDASPGEANFRSYISTATLSGTFAIANAVYDKGIGYSPNGDTWNSGIVGVAITNSYVASLGSSAGTTPGSITTSTILYSVPRYNMIVLGALVAPFTHSLFYFSLPTDKPNGFGVAATTSGTYLSDLDFESPTDVVSVYGKSLNTAIYTQSSPTTFTFTRINISPSKTDSMNNVPADILGTVTYTNMKVNYEHLTMFGGISPLGTGEAMVIMDEDGTTLGAPLGSFRSNLIWTNSAGANHYPVLYSLHTSPSHDPCGVDGSICDYNSVQSPGLSLGCPACQNAAKGYYSWFTDANHAGGRHDYSSDPMLVDTTRRVATWYLDGARKATPAAWTLSESVNAGDLRASSNAAFYSAKTVAYRALRTHTASNPLRPDGPGFNTDTDGSITSVVVSSGGQAHVMLKCTPACIADTVQVGDYAFFRGASLRNNPSVYQVTGVASDRSWFEVTTGFAAGTYTSGVIIDVWQNWWEPASLYQIRLDVASGTTYTSWAYSCNACAPAQAVQQWKAAGVRPTNEALRGYTYPGDTNSVTNPGAVQMAPLGIFPLPGGMRRR